MPVQCHLLLNLLQLWHSLVDHQAVDDVLEILLAQNGLNHQHLLHEFLVLLQVLFDLALALLVLDHDLVIIQRAGELVEANQVRGAAHIDHWYRCT